MSRKSPSLPPSMLDALLQELQQKTVLTDGSRKRRITKGHALMKSMVNEALSGDQKMLATVIRLAEKLDTMHAQKAEQSSLEVPPTSPVQWLALFAFYGRYKHLIEAQIEQLKTEAPDYWEFEWTDEPSLEKAPWHSALKSEK